MISAIMCTYNRSDTLRRALDSFLAQTCLDEVEHELIVVDNNSTDDTAEVVNTAVARDSRVRYVFEEEQGLSAARNRGVRESRGDIVAFLDDDVILDQRWLANLETSFAETEAAVVGGRAYLILEGETPEWLDARFRTYLSEVELGPTRCEVPNGQGLFGLNLSFRKDELSRAGAFDPALGRKGSGLLAGEETAIVKSIAARGGLIIYEPTAVVGHIIAPERLEWSYFVKVASSLGVSAARIRFDHDAMPVALARVLCVGIVRLMQGLILLPFGLVLGRRFRAGALRWVYYGLGLLKGAVACRQR
ncbi:MAG: glycosyltransferase [Phycisphaerae bacterium]|jgi:glycosyltransferase involved in cell wall biosynthesis